MNLNDILSGAFGGITINLTLNNVLRVAILLVVGVAVIRLLMKLVNRMLARSKALEALQAGQTLDAINVCIDSAIDSLLELTGERASDAVIDQVFARFCVGK